LGDDAEFEGRRTFMEHDSGILAGYTGICQKRVFKP